MKEVELRRAFLAEITKTLPRVRLYIRNVGVFQLRSGGWFRAGIKGQFDLYGWYLDTSDLPRPIEVELKTGTALSPEQKAWLAHCQGWGVLCVVLDGPPTSWLPTLASLIANA